MVTGSGDRPGAGSTTTSVGSSGSAPRRRRRGRVLLWILLVVVVVVAALIALAPMIAARVAPGIIESSVSEQIRGEVRVEGLSLGWFSDTRIGPVELVDPEGRVVARVTAALPVSLGRIVRERWWSASTLDVGTVRVSGTVDLVRGPEGESNLSRAVEPTGPSEPDKPEPPQQGGGPSLIRAALRVEDIDITVRDRAASGAMTDGPSLMDLQGELGAEYATGAGAAPAGVVAKGELGGQYRDVPSAAPTRTAVAVDATVKQRAGGGWSLAGLETLDVDLGVRNAPLTVVDALANLNNALVEAAGPTADVRLVATGSGDDARLGFDLTSAGLRADANLALRDGVLTVADAPRAGTSQGAAAGEDAPGVRVSLASTGFLAQLPQTREQVAQAGQTVTLTKSPSVRITVERLSVPVPASGFDLGTLDLRGASLVLRASVSELEGTVELPEAARAGGEARRPFAVEPIELVVDIPDLARPLSVQTGTRATLAGEPAGELRLSVTAEGLLDANGRLRATQAPAGAVAERAVAELTLSEVSTALVQPIVDGLDLPVVLRRDVGPAVTLVLRANTAGEGGVALPAGAEAGADADPLAGLPPLEANLRLTSQNVNAAGTVRLSEGIARTTGEEGLTLTVASLTPVLEGFLNRAPAEGEPPAAPPVTLGGRGRLELTVRNLVAPLAPLTGDGGLPAILNAVRGDLGLSVRELAVTPLPRAAEPVEGEPAPPPARPGVPVLVDHLTATARLDPAAAPRVQIDSAMSQGGNPFALTGDIQAPGVKAGLPGGETTPIQQLLALGLSGSVSLRDVPGALIADLGGFPAEAPDADRAQAAIGQFVRSTFGPSTTAVVTLSQAPENRGQDVRLEVQSRAQNVGANLFARLGPTEAELSGGTAFAGVDPGAANPVLAEMMRPAPPEPGAEPATPAPPPALASPFKVHLRIPERVVVPLRTGESGSVEPNWSGAGAAAVGLEVEGDVVVTNLPLGGAVEEGVAPPSTLRLRGTKAQANLPLRGLAPGVGERLRATFGAQALTGDGQVIATLAGEGGAAMGSFAEPQAVVRLTPINTAALDTLLRQQGLATGALGESAEVTLSIQPQDTSGLPARPDGSRPQVLSVRADLVSPRVEGARVALVYDQARERVYLPEPANITWTPDAAWLNRMLSGPATPEPGAQPPRNRRGRETAPPAGASAAQVTGTSSIRITIGKLVAAIPASAAPGQPATGPLKPGVFELDAQVTADQIGMAVEGAAPSAAAPGQQPVRPAGPEVLTMQGIRASVKTAPSQRRGEGAGGGAGGGGGGGPAIVADLAIGSVTGAGEASAQPSTASVTIDRLADERGVITTERALVNADAKFTAFPTSIVDALAQQGGILTEALGPTVSAALEARNVPMGANAPRGRVSAQVQSPRATAALNGRIQRGVFVQEGDVELRLLVIRPQLVEKLSGGLPLIDTLEKTQQDQPAVLTTQNLTVPLRKDMTELNGTITVDPGVARFTTETFFGRIVKGLGGRQEGTIGRRLEPFVIRANRGVLEYERFRLPIGEFTAETRGTVDLVQRRMNVVTYVPFFAITDEVAGVFNTGFAGKLGVIDQNTMVPISIKGPLDSPTAMPDLELFARETGQNLVEQPGKLLENLGDLLNPDRRKEEKK